jgi:putative membrane protein
VKRRSHDVAALGQPANEAEPSGAAAIETVHEQASAEEIMRTTLITIAALSLLGTGIAQAQTTVTGSPATDSKSSAQSGGQESVTRPNTDTVDKNNPGTTGAVTNAKLEPGANSFTEGQARTRLEKSGFTEVKDLKKDDQGIWRGTAQHAGKAVQIGLDFKGNVAVTQ